MLITLVSCAPKKAGVIVAGSTSVQPFIEKLADHFMEKNPGITINVQGGGSSAGIQATLNGTCDIGTSSRNLKPEEQGIETILIAVDGIAVIVNSGNRIDDLTIEQVRDIFARRIRNWKELGGFDKKIIPVTREEGSGTRASFEEMIMGDAAISDACLVQDSNGAVREIIATTLEGVGYISVGLVDEREKAIAIDGIKPTVANLTAGKYRFSRPFLLLLCKQPSPDVKKFVDYVLSAEGQDLLTKSGLIPATNVMTDR